jgi:shikimate dehydrogenase
MPSIIKYHCAVLGKPIAHSLSPVLHNAAYNALGLDDWEYTRVEVDEKGLDAFLSGLDPSWIGLSLTMPLKRSIQPYGVPSDHWSTALSVANTAVFSWDKAQTRPDIALYNTDVEGIEQAFDHCWQSNRLNRTARGAKYSFPADRSRERGAKAVILGNGNTALSAVAACTEISVPDTGSVTQLTVCARRPRDNDLLRQIAELQDGITYRQVPLARASEELLEADIVVNTIPSHGADVIAEQLAELTTRTHQSLTGKTLLDVVYDPRPTALMRAWRAASGIAIGGEEMLLYQAIAQVRLMTVGELKIKKTDFEQAMRSALQEAL